MRPLTFLALIGLTAAQICPPPEVLSPCTCFESTQSIECMYIRGRFNLKQIFDGASSHINDTVIFNRLFIYDTPLVEIEEDTFSSWKFLEISINDNLNLVYISPRAFDASREVTKELTLYMDRIDNDPPYEKDIFEFISGFKNLEKLWIPSNRLTSIPSAAFQNLSSLQDIYMAGNRISQIGSRAFAGAPNLKSLGIGSNDIPSGGLAPDAFHGIGELVEIDLTFNDWTTWSRAVSSRCWNKPPRSRLEAEHVEGMAALISICTAMKGRTGFAITLPSTKGNWRASGVTESSKMFLSIAGI